MAHLDPELHKYQKKIYSQNAEDGIIEYIFSQIEPHNRSFVEFGVGPPDGTPIEQNGLECNCRLLQENGWSGLYMDGNSYPPEYNVKTERVSPLNINLLLKRYGVPEELDLLSIDVDGQDFWIWAFLVWLPKVVIIEYNPHFTECESKTIPFDLNYRWDGTQWYGASLMALYRLGIAKGYTLVFANGVNAFFVRRDLLSNPEDFPYERVFYYRGKISYHLPDTQNRPWVFI